MLFQMVLAIFSEKGVATPASQHTFDVRTDRIGVEMWVQMIQCGSVQPDPSTCAIPSAGRACAYGRLLTTPLNSSSVNARSVSVRTFPWAPIESNTAAAVLASAACVIATKS